MASPLPLARLAVAGAAAAATLSALVWRRPTPLPGTTAITDALAAVLPPRVAYPALELGEPRTVAVVGTAVTAYGLVARRVDVLAVVAASAAALVSVQHVGKPLVGHLLEGTPIFPSGHAAASLVCAAMVAVAASRAPSAVRRVVWAGCAATATVGSLAPVALGAHYPIDPVGSAAAVTFWVCGALAVVQRATRDRPTLRVAGCHLTAPAVR